MPSLLFAYFPLVLVFLYLKGGSLPGALGRADGGPGVWILPHFSPAVWSSSVWRFFACETSGEGDFSSSASRMMCWVLIPRSPLCHSPESWALITLAFLPFLHLVFFLPQGLCTCCPLSSECSSFLNLGLANFPSSLRAQLRLYSPETRLGPSFTLFHSPHTIAGQATYSLWISTSSSIKWRQQVCLPSRTTLSLIWVHATKVLRMSEPLGSVCLVEHITHNR